MRIGLGIGIEFGKAIDIEGSSIRWGDNVPSPYLYGNAVANIVMGLYSIFSESGGNTLTGAGDILPNQRVVYVGATNGTFVQNQTYYVKNLVASTFNLSETLGGPEIAIPPGTSYNFIL